MKKVLLLLALSACRFLAFAQISSDPPFERPDDWRHTITDEIIVGKADCSDITDTIIVGKEKCTTVQDRSKVRSDTVFCREHKPEKDSAKKPNVETSIPESKVKLW